MRSHDIGVLNRCGTGDFRLRRFREPQTPARRLVWFPFGGGSSHVFVKVATRLPADWTVDAFEYPGHLHSRGTAFNSIDPLCEALLHDAGADILEGAWLMGHSLGGLVAARLAHLLERQGRPAGGCIVCAAKPPARIDPWPHLSNRSREEMLERWLHMIGEQRSDTLEALFDMIELSMRADMRVYESCAGIDVRLEHTPLLVLVATDDTVAPAGQMKEWHLLARKAELDFLQGGHLFVLSEPATVAERVTAFALREAEPAFPVAAAGRWAAPVWRTERLSVLAGAEVELPVVIAPAGMAADATGTAAFLGSETALAELLLLEFGALLLRGWTAGLPADLAASLDAMSDRPLDYLGGNAPRQAVGRSVYTSTEYPAELEISPHAEMSYAPRWPRRLYFTCAREAMTGGQTPLVDLRALMRALPAALVDEFKARGLKYMRRLHSGAGFGRSWSETFATRERSRVERLLAKQGAAHEWLPDGDLAISQLGPATIRHWITGEDTWFNQAEQWHPANLPAPLRDALADDELPHGIRFGDGGLIPDEIAARLREALWLRAGQFDWRAGDLLIVDNERMAHGRRAFSGPRRVLVAMGDNAAGTSDIEPDDKINMEGFPT